MIKKIVIIFTITALFSPAVVLADGVSLPGLTPESRFYFLDNWAEKITLLFTFGTKNKTEKLMEYANEKMAEVKLMAEKSKPLQMNEAMEQYQYYLTKANRQVGKIKGKSGQGVVSFLKQEINQQQQSLSQIYEKVPEPARKPLEQTIEVVKNIYDRIVNSLTGQGMDLEEESEISTPKGSEIIDLIKEKLNSLFDFLNDLRGGE